MCIACENLLNKKWNKSPTPNEPGVQILRANLEELLPFIDWKYFLYAWGFPLSLSIIEENTERGDAARKLLNDGKVFLNQIVEKKMCEAKAVIGLFSICREEDDVTVFSSAESTSDILAKVHFLRQQEPSEKTNICHSLADYLSPKEKDWLGFFALSVGFGVEEKAKILRSQNDDYHAILLETLSGRLTEAYSEKLHLDVMRKHWGYSLHKTWGIRPAIGYPSAPDHSEKETLWKLLNVEENIGIKLTESYMMLPLNSACGYYFAHPKSHYFSVGKVGEDQLKDYVKRKGNNPMLAGESF